MSYDANIQIAGLTLDINPSQYSPVWLYLGQINRTCGGGLLDINRNGLKLSVEIAAITNTQMEDIKKRVALQKSISFIDFVPISEKGTQSRTVYEDIESEVINGETIYVYVPEYRVYINPSSFKPVYRGGIREFTLSIQEV